MKPSPKTTPLSVGGFALGAPVLLAPMSGVTDLPFRRIVARLGAGAVVSEMVACEQLVARESEAVLRLDGAGISPHIVQLAGREPQWIEKAARVAEASGADIIDLNMGCPAKRVVNGYAGSALMRDLDLAVKLIEAAVGAVKVPVTVKMRLGWDHGSMNAPELARRAQDAGVAMITVHARTRCQFYKGEADWSLVRPVREACSLPLVVNGDIASADDARAAMRACDADGVMVGRASLGRPWLIGAIGAALSGGAEPVAPSLLVQRDLALEHYDLALSHYGMELGRRMVRKHLAAYLESAGNGEVAPQIRDDVLGDHPVRHVRAAIKEFYELSHMARAA